MRRSLARERGSALVESMLVTVLLVALAVAVVQLALALHVRNTVLDAAAEGARYAALAGNGAADGIERTRVLIDAAVSDAYARDVTATVSTARGAEVVEVRVRAPLPLVGLIGLEAALDVSGHAVVETYG
nr:TadE/TadG family type IV pilus assembly protein [Agromyces rhizosphaerae]